MIIFQVKIDPELGGEFSTGYWICVTKPGITVCQGILNDKSITVTFMSTSIRDFVNTENIMSIVRWGSLGSSVYIYESVEDEIVCCGCFLMPEADESKDDSWYGFKHISFTCNSFDDMITHVRQHIDSGDTVPDFVIPEIERRRDDPGWRSAKTTT